MPITTTPFDPAQHLTSEQAQAELLADALVVSEDVVDFVAALAV